MIFFVVGGVVGGLAGGALGGVIGGLGKGTLAGLGGGLIKGALIGGGIGSFVGLLLLLEKTAHVICSNNGNSTFVSCNVIVFSNKEVQMGIITAYLRLFPKKRGYKVTLNVCIHRLIKSNDFKFQKKWSLSY